VAGAHARVSRAGCAGRTTRPAQPAPGNGRAGRGRLAEVARSSTLNLAGAGISALATLALTVLVTRQFSRPVAGAFFTAISLFLIVEAVASLGAFTGLVYFLARLRSLGAENRIPAILRTAVIPVIVVSLLAAAALLLAATPLSRLLLDGQLGRAGATPAAVARALRALALTLPFATLLDTFLGASRGYRNMRPTVLVDRIARSSAQLIGVAVAAAAGSAALLAPLWALPYVPAGAAAWLWLRRIQRRQRERHEDAPVAPPPAGGQRLADRRLANANPRGFWRFTTPRAIASLAQITIQRIDIVLVAIMRGPAEAAVYTAATRFLVAGQLGNGALSMAAQPRFTELFAVGNRRGANDLYQTTTGWLVLLTWPLYLLAVIYGPEVLTLFGHAYRAGDSVMVILGLTMLLATACGQVDMVLITTGRSSWSLANGLLAVGINVGLDLVLIPRYGIEGAAIGWSAAIVTTNLLPLAQLAAVSRLHPFGPGTVWAITLTTASFAGAPLALRAVLGAGGAASLAGAVTGCLVMAAGLWRFRQPLRLVVMPGFPRHDHSRPDKRRISRP
jgi:O-antigen/teichoic acid export membrane protein